MSFYWPIILIVVSNIFYHISSKSTPSTVNPFASLTVTYMVGAVVSAAVFFVTSPGESLLQQYRNLNWSAFVLGFTVGGLEVGSIYMYQAGWNISTGQLVYSSILAMCLIVVGYFFYHEAITPTKVTGMVICLVGLFLINR